MQRLLIIIILTICVYKELYNQQFFLLSGNIQDQETNQAIPAVNIRVQNTTRGTITNSEGFYQLSLPEGRYKIIYSHVGYKSDSIEISLTNNLVKNLVLSPVQIQMPEILVLAEDPAVEIIRRAIANKHLWMEKLKSYKFEAFTRQVIYSDTTIAGISEAYTDGYWRRGDTLREVVKQKRQTLNIPAAGNLAAVRQLANFSEDIVRLFGYSFIGPTAKNALDNYDYKLLRTFTREGYDVYEISIHPKFKIKPLFYGKILIADYSYALVGVDVYPNESFNIPFVRDLELNYRQQFSLYDEDFWLPTDIRIKGAFKINFAGMSFPKFTFEQTSVVYDYKINVELPDTIFQKPRVSVDSSSNVYDSLYWKQNEYLPLTSTEQAAYDSLDSTRTFGVLFRPGGATVVLFGDTSGVFKILNYIDFRFNRVEGFFLGGKYENDSLTQTISLSAKLGYGFSDNLAKGNVSIRKFFWKSRKVGVGLNIYRKFENVPDGNFYDPFTISLSSLIGKNDYRDYFLSSGWSGEVLLNPVKKLNATLLFISEWHRSLNVNTDFSFVSLGNKFRDNPEIQDGKYRSISFYLRYGDEPIPFNLISQDEFRFNIEHSNPDLLNSDYKFTKIHFGLIYNLKTFLLNHLFPPTLKLGIFGGISSGHLPPQKSFTLDSRLSSFAPFGVLKTAGVKEYVGDKFISINLEHNFRSIPFLALGIPFLYKRNTELIIFASAARMWATQTDITNGWYYEAGLGIGKILDILRFDFSYRIPNNSRNGKIFFTVSTSSLF